MTTRTTYRRADGTKKFVGDVHGDWFTNEPPADWIQEQWDGDTLVRHRTIRLGANEPCGRCNKGWRNYPEDGIFGRLRACIFCNSTGIKPRDTNPTWTTVLPDSVPCTNPKCVLDPACDCGGYGKVEPPERAEAVAEPDYKLLYEQWKQVATQLKQAIRNNEHWCVGGGLCTTCNAISAYNSVLTQVTT